MHISRDETPLKKGGQFDVIRHFCITVTSHRTWTTAQLVLTGLQISAVNLFNSFHIDLYSD